MEWPKRCFWFWYHADSSVHGANHNSGDCGQTQGWIVWYISELYGTSQTVLSPSEEWSIEMIMVQNFRVSFGEFLFANPVVVTVFKNSGASKVVRVSSFFIMKVTRQYFQHSNEFSHRVHSSMKCKKTPVSGFQLPQLQGKNCWAYVFQSRLCSSR